MACGKGVIRISREATPYKDGPNLAPGWVAETIAIWTQFPTRKGILDLTGRNLSELPAEIFRMRKLETLILNENYIQKIPKQLSKLAEAKLLKTILCNNNLLTEIDESIGSISSLENIDFSHNAFTSVPSSIGKLFQLIQLDLSYNAIEEVPGAIGNLLFLEKLDLSHNEIKSLPQTLMNLEQLQYFDISYNHIERISPAIANMSRLTLVRVNNNNLEALPLEMGFLLGVTEWEITGNPFTQQPEINEQSLFSRTDITNYLRLKIRKDEELRKRLFEERDSKFNTLFEVIEGETKPTLTGATAEKLVLFLTQVGLPDMDTYYCLSMCYSYFIAAEELITLFYYRIQMNHTPKCKKDQRRVEEIVRSRALFGLEYMFQAFNRDGVVLSSKVNEIVENLLFIFGYNTMKQLLLLASQNKGIDVHQFNVNHIDFAREQRRMKDRQEKELVKQQKERRKHIEKEKKKVSKLLKQRKKEKLDRATEKIAFGLSHSNEERHILLFHPSDIAQQIVRMDSECFNKIPSQDFLHQSWSKRPETSGVVQCITHFNNLSNWVITWIVQQFDIKTRLRTVQHLLDIAADLFEFGDFLALFSFASAFSGASVSRLKQTIGLLDERRKMTLETLESLVDNSGNYRVYRDMLEMRIAEGHCIPQLALYLRNLTFMEDGNSNFLLDTVDLINIGKFRLISRTIAEIEAMKELGYEGIIDPSMLIEKLILTTPRLDDSEAQYQHSITCEPRVKHRGDKLSQDKDRRVSLPSRLKKKELRALARSSTSNSVDISRVEASKTPQPLSRLKTD